MQTLICLLVTVLHNTAVFCLTLYLLASFVCYLSSVMVLHISAMRLAAAALYFIWKKAYLDSNNTVTVT